MKKTVLIFALAVLVVFSMFGASAEDFTPDNVTGKYTVICDLSEIVDSDEMDKVKVGESQYGLVAVRGANVTEVSLADEIVYIDQATAVLGTEDDGEYKDKLIVKFEEFLPMDPLPDDESFKTCTLFIGGDGLGTAKNIGVLREKQDGVVISGTVVDTVAPDKLATITVYDSNDVQVGSSATTAANGTFSVTVPVGTNYSIKFSKKAYLSFTYTGINAQSDVNLVDPIDMTDKAGNIIEDSQITIEDLNALLDDYGNSKDSLINPESNLNGDSQVTIEDLTALLAGYGKGHEKMTYPPHATLAE